MPPLFYQGKHPRLLALAWFGFGGLALVGDYVSGPFLQFPFLYLIPVSLAAWYSGWRIAVPLAVALPLTRLFFIELLWSVPWSLAVTLANTTVKISIFVLFAVTLSRLARLQREVKVLRGFLPICSFCKKIRGKSGSWQQLEHYISTHSEASFTHGLCPECAQEHYGLGPEKLP